MGIIFVYCNIGFAVPTKGKQFIFFYTSGCDYCHHMADILQKIGTKHRFHIIAISDDGIKIPQFPNVITDKELMNKFKIVAFPVLIAVDLHKKEFELLCNGLEQEYLVEAKMLAWMNNA